MNKNILLHVPSLSTQYELMIGKTESPTEGEKSDTNYHKGMYFVASLQDNVLATFASCSSGLEHRLQDKKFGSPIDCFAIAGWLNTFDSPETLLNSKDSKFTYELSNDEIANFYKEQAEE